MKKTTYIIIGLLLLVLILQIAFFCLLRVSAEPWDDYRKRIEYEVNRDVIVETVDTVVSEATNAVGETNENYVTSLNVPDGNDIEVVIKVKNPSKLKKASDWVKILESDSINANTLMINVDGNSTMKVEISQED